MTDTPTPDEGTPGIGRITIPIPDHLFADDGNLVLDTGQTEAFYQALYFARGARLHLGAMLELLQKCPQQHPIPAGLYVGNLLPIHERMEWVIARLELACGEGDDERDE